MSQYRIKILLFNAVIISMLLYGGYYVKYRFSFDVVLCGILCLMCYSNILYYGVNLIFRNRMDIFYIYVIVGMSLIGYMIEFSTLHILLYITTICISGYSGYDYYINMRMCIRNNSFKHNLNMIKNRGDVNEKDCMDIEDYLDNTTDLHFCRHPGPSRSIFMGKYRGKPIMYYITHQPIKDTKQLCPILSNITSQTVKTTKYNGYLWVKSDICVNWPATDADMKLAHKTIHQRIFETPKMYRQEIYIIPNDNTWMATLLDGSNTQVERIHNDNIFILIPDVKWNLTDIDSIYCLAIVREKIPSIRELNASHIPMLEHIYETTIVAMKRRYKVDESKLKFFFHYHPTYWHLHIHVCHIDLVRNGMCVNKAHALIDVIRNLELNSNYYANGILEILVVDE